MNLPITFENKMKSLLGTEFHDYITCYEAPRYYGLRVNTQKISVERFLEIAPFDLTPIPWIENGFYYDGEHISPSKHPYYFAGLYYLQEPSAMTPANRLPVFPGERVLDVCAAPGGKATELGAKAGRQGLLVANDISSSRAKGLLKNLEVFGIGSMLTISEEPEKLAQYFPEYFDKILIDAPCSGEGMFRKDKKMVKAWEEHGPEFFSEIQRDILLQAADMLRPGGMMLYSTCTFDGQENEGAIAYLLEQCPDFEVQEIANYEGFEHGDPLLAESSNESLSKTIRIYPHKMKGEGHFLALLKKTGTSQATISKDRQTSGAGIKKIPDEMADFFKDIAFPLLTERLKIQGERVYYMPENLPEMKKVRFLRTGLLLGELKKKRFEPNQALAMYLKKEEYAHTLDFPALDERVTRYLKGETIEVPECTSKGWQLVCVDGFPLGWGKLSNGTLKNKYLPGWRNQSV